MRYLPPALINDIFEGKVSMDTKPATQEITVLFSDLSGFTKMSEEQGAETVAEFLNDYLTVMNETIFQNHGTIDKFIGDAIMVLFGAPVSMSSAEQAQNAAAVLRPCKRGWLRLTKSGKAKALQRGLDEDWYSSGHRGCGKFRLATARRLYRHWTKRKPRLENRVRLRTRRNLRLA